MTIVSNNIRHLILLLLFAEAVLLWFVSSTDYYSHSNFIFLSLALTLSALLVFRTAFYAPTEDKPSKPETNKDGENIRLALSFQGLAKLDAAFALFKQCQANKKLAVLLNNLAADYEVINQPENAKEVYEYILSFQPENLNAKHKLSQFKTEALAKRKNSKSNSLFNNRYEVIRCLGKGSGSSVFLAKDFDNDEEYVAVKILEINYDEKNELESELFARFMREADTAASLQHDNIIRIIDSGHAGHVAYIAMEFIRGKTLREYSDPHTILPPPIVLDLMAQCADGLHYAHNKGIIHRDVKPANILFDRNTNVAKLGDFGIARIANSTQTLAGSFLGTPFYMSPEQLGGLELDARSDIFSLGATLFRLLTGTPPFSGNSMAELMRAIANDPHRDINLIKPDLHPAIVNMVNKALSKDPKQRQSDAQELSNQLRECIQLV